ncbi:hypothetical protein ABZP36_024224 [Zizania latifolia]
MSLVVSTFGDGLQRELPACLPIPVNRMGNEIARLTEVKSFAVIAKSPLRIDLSCVLNHVISELTAFLQKANRALRQATLGTLNSLVAYGGQIGSSYYETIIAELSTPISWSNRSMQIAVESSRGVGRTIPWTTLVDCALQYADNCRKEPRLLLLWYLPKPFYLLIYDYQHNLGLVLLEQKELTSKYEQLRASSESAEIMHKRGCASQQSSLAEATKREENLKKNIGIQKECVANLEKAVHDMRVETAEIKVSYETKFADALQLMEAAHKKSDEVDNQQKKEYEYYIASFTERGNRTTLRQSVDHTGQRELQNSNVEKILALLFNHCEMRRMEFRI